MDKGDGYVPFLIWILRRFGCTVKGQESVGVPGLKDLSGDSGPLDRAMIVDHGALCVALFLIRTVF